MNDLDIFVSMLANSSALSSSPNTTTTSLTPTEITPGLVEGEQIFFQTATARGVSGIFVWLSLIITCHQVRNCTNVGFNNEYAFVYCQNESVQVMYIMSKYERTCVSFLFFLGSFVEFSSLNFYTVILIFFKI